MPKWGEPVSKDLLAELYFRRGLSAQQIADRLSVSYHKIAYWMDRHGLQRRSPHEASYRRHNPGGEKFTLNLSKRELFVAGVALYMGEGDKTNPSVIVTNSDVRVLKLWVRFLGQVCGVPAAKLKGHIDCYADLDYSSVLDYWSQQLGIPAANFERPTLKRGRVANGNSDGRRTTRGTAHVKFHDAKLKSQMLKWIDEIMSLGT
jgi:hypothetical protein